MSVLLSAVSQVLADHLELLVDLDGLHDVTVGRAAQGRRHQADSAGELACRDMSVLQYSLQGHVGTGQCNIACRYTSGRL